ncbi:retrovirus-related pol polyprotein from transposon TNT 1-94 [Tanacetum coccineum]
MTESPIVDSGFVVPVFSPGDDPIACLNKAMAFLTVVASSRFPSTNNQLRTLSKPSHYSRWQGHSATSSGETRQGLLNATTVKVKDIWLGNALSLSDQGMQRNPGVPNSQAVQTIIPSNAAFQTEDLDTYDSDCDDVLNTKEILMANISNYGSDVISKNCPLKKLWLRMSNPTSKPSDASHVKIEAPKELPKSSVDKQCLEIAKKELLLENDRLLQQIMSQDVLLTVMNYMSLIGKEIVDIAAQIPSANTIVPRMFKLDLEPLAPRLLQNKEAHIDYLKYTQKQADILWGIVIQIVLWYLDSGCSRHMTGNLSQLMNFVSKFLGTVRFENDHIARIIGYGDYRLGNVTISRVYYVEGLGHNLFSVGSRDTNLYTISLDDMLKTSPICLLSKASKTKSWLWHRRLSHLNFACALGKSKKSSHQPKAEDTNQEKLYLLHMDLCGPMRVASINRKRYILVIVDDYSRFTWVRFLRTKDEAPKAIIKCIKNIQVCLNATVRNVRTDNGTEFVNQTLREFYENVGISHQTSVARTPQQNDVVERRN